MEQLTKRELKAARREIEKRNDSLEGGSRWRTLDFLICMISVLVFAFALRSVVVEPVRVKGPSMLDTLHEGDYMVVEKLSYVFETPQRGDILICYYPPEYYAKYHASEEANTCVKRVIGEGGDTVEIADGVVRVNGVQLDESYLSDTVFTTYSQGSITVPQGYIFVMGDNRNISADSRNADVGCIPLTRVVGRVRCIAFPFDRMRSLTGVRYEGLS